ncbi:MAG: baseplate J/gp47 family protein [Candidatus Nanopelagicales bacterium]
MSDQSPVANPAGQPVLQRRVATHAVALARMREDLAAPGHHPTVRSLAHAPADPPADPGIAVLDAFAVVSDIVAFYSERIATEGFLRTATRLESVRELARMLGYELRPGVSAQTDLVFTCEDADGSPGSVDVPAGTPVQSVPGDGELPQTFETAEQFEARAVWNALPVLDTRAQELGYGRRHIWLKGRSDVVVGDAVLVVGAERVGYGEWPPAQPREPQTLDDDERWDFRTVTAVDADALPGWTRLDLERPIGYRRSRTLTAERDVTVHRFAKAARLFGANAPDPNLLADDDGPPPGASLGRRKTYVWDGFDVVSADAPTVIEVDGAHPDLQPGSWVVLEQPGKTEAYLVARVTPDGAAKFAVTGPLTRVRLDLADGLPDFDRRRATVHCISAALPAAEEPDDSPQAVRTLRVPACDPPLAAGRRVVLAGTDADTGAARAQAATIASVTVTGDVMEVVLDTGLAGRFLRQELMLHANVVRASHGEGVEQVLGSGDGREAFATFTTRRAPLTHLRAISPAGARAELTVRVDGVAWEQVESLDQAGPRDRVYTLAYDEQGAALITLGDGVNGARPATGTENIKAAYRVGIGQTGALLAGQLSLLTRRPLGIRAVTNLAATSDWAPPETLEQARVNAGLRVRTLDRAVSVADYADFARTYAGVGPARADLVWDGRSDRVVVSVLGTGATPPSDGLIADLHTALDGARDPGSRLDVQVGVQTWFAVRVEVAHDLAYERDTVVAGVRAGLTARFGPASRVFATPVTAAAVLVAVKAVPGVLACTMPRLLPLASVPPEPQVPDVPPDSLAVDPAAALPARWDGRVLPAQLLALVATEIGEMRP